MIARPKIDIYDVITTSVVTTEYRIKAHSKEEAQEKFYDGDYIDMFTLDYHDENIVEINVEENKYE